MKRLLPLLLTGCATFDQEYVTPPNLGTVVVSVVWTTEEEIRRPGGVCGDAAPSWTACATVGTRESPMSTIWAQMPASFSDARKVCALGHEVLHSLGATHK